MSIVLASGSGAAGQSVPCPTLDDAGWYEGVGALQAADRVVGTLSSTIVRDELQEGEAVVQAVVDSGGTPGVQARITRTSVWDTVLVDSFQDDICPGADPSDSISPDRAVFFGDNQGRVIRLNRGNQELGTDLVGFLRPNVVAPAGIGATCLFRNVYVAVDRSTGGTLQVTPVLDGEVLTDEAITIIIPTDGTRQLQRFEVPLSRAYEVSATEVARAGLVGTWFTVELEVVDAFGCGRISVDGIDLEYVPHRKGEPGPTFTGESLVATVPVDSKAWYFAGNGSGVYKGAQGTDDNGTAILVRMETNALAPAGASGECVFNEVEMSFTRFNETDWTFTATPIVDGVALQGQDVTLAGVANPVTEVVTLDLAQEYLIGGVAQSTFHPRGAWLALLLEATAAPDKDVIVEGVEMDYDIVEESLEDVTNA